MSRSVMLICVGFFLAYPVQMRAQAGIIEAVKNATAKIIKAVDLKVQRLQNETIWLQNVQKSMENALSKLKLREIHDWVEKQRALYDGYFDELYKVKKTVASYHRVRQLMQKQTLLFREYKRSLNVFKADPHFSSAEVAYMKKVSQRILAAGTEGLNLASTVLESFAMQMSDAQRMKLINRAANTIEQSYDALRHFNYENGQLSLSRAKDLDEAAMLKAMYGL